MAAADEPGGLPPPEDDEGVLALLLAEFDRLLERARALGREVEGYLRQLFGGDGLPARGPSHSWDGRERRRSPRA